MDKKKKNTQWKKSRKNIQSLIAFYRCMTGSMVKQN